MSEPIIRLGLYYPLDPGSLGRLYSLLRPWRVSEI